VLRIEIELGARPRAMLQYDNLQDKAQMVGWMRAMKLLKVLRRLGLKVDA
jgi:hypothetical protein